jgi:hypothetical protein
VDVVGGGVYGCIALSDCGPDVAFGLGFGFGFGSGSGFGLGFGLGFGRVGRRSL